MALELLLGTDILSTAIARTWNEIGKLEAIAVLRTSLNFFLERELKASGLQTKKKWTVVRINYEVLFGCMYGTKHNQS